LGRVTLSGGAHAVNRGNASTPLALLETADAALYLAKQNGRNRVCQEADRPSAAVVKLPSRL
jgi:PleD family two-component response regulator